MSDSTAQPKKKREMLTSFSIIFILLAVVAVVTIILSGVTPDVTGATLGDFLMAPAKGFADAIDVCLFVMVLGGFLGIVNKTDALNTGIAVLVKRMHGNELRLIPVLMGIFAIGGSTYGMCEETVGFYALLSATMMAAGYDSLTGAMMVLLGAGVGCLGSTVNPFATGVASAALTDLGITVDQGVVIGLGLVLLVVAYAIAVFFVLQYAKSVKADPSRTLMSAAEIESAEATYKNEDLEGEAKNVSLTGKQKAVLWIFGAAFLVMVISFIPWEDLGVDAFVAGSASHDEVAEVTADDIAEVVSRWTGIPVSRMLQSERDKLLHLEAELHRRVIGQNEAIEAVSNAVRRSRAGLQDPNRPIASFIFLGTTGVGKTELAKALAEYLFNDENMLTRIDMSEYQEKFSVTRLIGAPPGYVGYDEGGQLTEAVRRKPYSVVLFDEIEKAHPDVFNTLLQVLDDGRLTDNKGRLVNFKNTIIIMTSNATREQLTKLMRPEFLNRIDDIITFHALTKEEIGEVVELQMKRVQKMLAAQGFTLHWTKETIDDLAELGYDPEFGARPVKRAIQDYVLNDLSRKILEGKVGKEITLGHIEA